MLLYLMGVPSTAIEAQAQRHTRGIVGEYQVDLYEDTVLDGDRNHLDVGPLGNLGCPDGRLGLCYPSSRIHSFPRTNASHLKNNRFLSKALC